MGSDWRKREGLIEMEIKLKKPLFLKNWEKKDIILFSGVILIISLIYLSPDEIKQRMVLIPSNPSILSMFFSHYVHLTDMHLIGNIIGFITVLILIFSLQPNKKSLYQFSCFSFFLLPLILSILQVYFLSSSIYPNFGFSGIVSAFVGYYLVVLYEYMKKNVGKIVDKNFYLVLIFANMLGVVYSIEKFSNIFYVSAFGLLVYFVSIRDQIYLILVYVWKKIQFESPKDKNMLFWAMNFTMSYLTMIIKLGIHTSYALFALVFFLVTPESINNGVLIPVNGAVPNILVHYFGFVAGAFFPYLISSWELVIKMYKEGKNE